MASFGATFTVVETLNNNDGEWLERVVGENDIIIVSSASTQNNKYAPEIIIEGVEHSTVKEGGSVPYGTVTIQGTPYFTGCWSPCSGGSWNTPIHHFPPVITSVKVACFHAGGTVRAMAKGDDIFDLTMRVLRPSITPAADTIINRVGWTLSIQDPQIQGSQAQMDVLQDDIIIAIGTDSTPQYATANISWVSGPANQEIYDVLSSHSTVAGYPGVSTRVKAWKIQAPGTVKLNYAGCNLGRSMGRLYPNVEASSTVRPVLSEDRGYFEIQTEVNANGDVRYSDWFKALYRTMRNNSQWGLRKSWLREVLEWKYNPDGEIEDVRSRRIEQWTVPDSAWTSVDTSAGALMFEDRNEADARIIHHNNRW